jgi:hypothetical protein
VDSPEKPKALSREDLVRKLLTAAFERAARGEPGRTPEELMDLVEERLGRSHENALSPEREAELKGLVDKMGLRFDENTDPAIRHVNGKIAEWELDGSIPPEKRGQRYEDNNDNKDGEIPPPAPAP